MGLMKSTLVLAICCLAMVACSAEKKDSTEGATSRKTVENASTESVSIPRLVYYTISDG